MTDQPEPVEVTQADRDAAAEFLDLLGFPHFRPLVDGTQRFKDGGGEKALLIIVRHRLSALRAQPSRDDVAEVRSAVFEVLRRHDVSEQCFAEVAMVTHAAIRARKESQ